MDLDGDGIISRCEDAQFQATFGEDPAFAKKFGNIFTADSIEKVCGRVFPF